MNLDVFIYFIILLICLYICILDVKSMFKSIFSKLLYSYMELYFVTITVYELTI